MDRITRVRIENVRAIESVELELGRPLTVLIGENGSGKSTILECLELLRKAAEPNFLQRFYQVHRGMTGMLRKGATSFTLGVDVEDDAGALPPLRYALTLAAEGGGGASISSELLWAGPSAEANGGMLPDPTLTAALGQAEAALAQRPRIPATRSGTKVRRVSVDPVHDGLVAEVARVRDALRASTEARSTEPLAVIRRAPTGLVLFDEQLGGPKPWGMDPGQPTIGTFGDRPPHPAVDRLVRVLRGVELHLGFDTLASWVARSHQRPETLRVAGTLFPADRLAMLGTNLANAWAALRNREHVAWDRTLRLARLGLGERLESVLVSPDPGGGNVYLAVRFLDLPEPVVAGNLSDGQLAWLAFVALTQLHPDRSVLVVDEPELHLHPSLLGRVVSLLSNLPGGGSAVLCTHSDRVLELLDDPVDAVRVCRLEGSRAEVSRLDAAELPRWLEQFGDLGQLRAAGYLSRVVAPARPPGPSEQGSQ